MNAIVLIVTRTVTARALSGHSTLRAGSFGQTLKWMMCGAQPVEGSESSQKFCSSTILKLSLDFSGKHFNLLEHPGISKVEQMATSPLAP